MHSRWHQLAAARWAEAHSSNPQPGAWLAALGGALAVHALVLGWALPGALPRQAALNGVSGDRGGTAAPTWMHLVALDRPLPARPAEARADATAGDEAKPPSAALAPARSSPTRPAQAPGAGPPAHAGVAPEPMAPEAKPLQAAGAARQAQAAVDTAASHADVPEAPQALEAAPSADGREALLRQLARPLPHYDARLPGAFDLSFQMRRGPVEGSGQLRFQPDAAGSYRLALDLLGPLRPMWQQASQGQLGTDGLLPAEFVDRRQGRRIGQTRFDRELGRVHFSGSAPALPMAGAAQDRLSWLVQLPAIVAADPALRRAGAQIWLQVFGARGGGQVWRFEALGLQPLSTPQGESLTAWHFRREAERLYDTEIEIWLDAGPQHLPRRIHLTHVPSGDRIELWR